MSDLNLPFRTNLAPGKPYSYIRASLDLAGALAGDTLYFNKDNSTAYLTTRDYYRFIQITNESIIDDVIVSTLNDPVVTTAETANGPLFTIGGAQSTALPVVVPYAAPAGFGPQTPPQFSGAALRTNQLNANPVNYFGHSAAAFPYGEDNNGNPDLNTNYKYLAITVSSPDVATGTVLVTSGTVEITLKLISK